MTEDNINMLIYVVGVVAIIFLLIFRKSIAEFFNRMYLIKWGRGELRATQSKDLRDALDPSQKGGGKKQFNDERDVFRSFLRTEKETAIKAEIYARNDLDPDGRINLLINRLSIAYLKSIFDRVYRTMSRREIQLLRKFNSYQGPKGWAKKDAESYCQQATKNSLGIVGRPIDEGIDFLIDFFLIEIENDSYRITELGIDFLAWLTIEGKAEK